jgi:septal ring factor EnvC (AmiA/AmiB activator)
MEFGEAVTAVAVAIGTGLAAYKTGGHTERKRRTVDRPPQHQNGSVVHAAADLLGESTQALAAERKAREDAWKKVEELIDRCSQQADEIATLKAAMESQERTIKSMRATIANLQESMARLEHFTARDNIQQGTSPTNPNSKEQQP